MDIEKVAVKRFALIVGTAMLTCVLFKYFKRYCSRRSHRFQPVILCNNISDWTRNENKLMKGLYSTKFVGLDCEWVTVNEKRKPVALLQLANADGMILLIRLCNIPPGLIPCTLMGFLADKKVIKVGVNICDDADKLLRDYGLIVESCLDLRHLVENRSDFKNCNNLSLQTLTQVILKADLKKTTSLSCSDWEAEALSPKQVAYAAEDALSAAQIFHNLLELSHNQWFFCNLDSKFKKYEHIINVPYKRKDASQKLKHASCKSDLIKFEQPQDEEKVRKLCKQLDSRNLRNRMPYSNCLLEAPDGEPLCSCDYNKALWYVEKGRAEVISNKEPYVVRLNFEPSGRPILDNKYYIQGKPNYCIVCGEEEFLLRKFIVPSEYRKHFPSLMKKNLSHDVVFLCVVCHRRSNIIDQKLREQLAMECDAPIENITDVKKANYELRKVKNAANVLSSKNKKIPEKRKAELLQILRDHYNTETVTDGLIAKAGKIDFHIMLKDDYILHSLKVYQHFCKNEGLIALESRWRKHFLDTMRPKYLPDMWSIDHNHQRLALQVLKNKADFDVSILGLSDELMEEAKKLI